MKTEVNNVNVEKIDENELIELENLEKEDLNDDIFASKDSSRLLLNISLLNSSHPYTVSEEKDAFERLTAAKKAGNKALYKEIFDEISQHNMRLVAKVASKYAPFAKSLTFEDLMIEGYLGLRKGIEYYKPEYGYRFSTYAMHWIRQSVSREIMNSDDLIRLPVHVQEKIRSYNIASDEDKEKMLENNRNLQIALSLSTPTSMDVEVNDDDHDATTFGEFIPAKDNTEDECISTVRDTDLREALLNAIERYAKTTRVDQERIKDILFARFGFDCEVHTLQNLADKYHITRERVRQIEAAFLKFARHGRTKVELLSLAGDEYKEKDPNLIREQNRRNREYRELLEKAGYEYTSVNMSSSENVKEEESFSCEEENEFDIENG